LHHQSCDFIGSPPALQSGEGVAEGVAEEARRRGGIDAAPWGRGGFDAVGSDIPDTLIL